MLELVCLARFMLSLLVLVVSGVTARHVLGVKPPAWAPSRLLVSVSNRQLTGAVVVSARPKISCRFWSRCSFSGDSSKKNPHSVALWSKWSSSRHRRCAPRPASLVPFCSSTMKFSRPPPRMRSSRVRWTDKFRRWGSGLRAEAVTIQSQFKKRFVELAAKVASLPARVDATALVADVDAFDKLLQEVGLSAIRESGSQFKPKCQSASQPGGRSASEPPTSGGGGGVGSGSVPAGQADTDMPPASGEDEEALRNFMSAWSTAQGPDASSEARKRVADVLAATAKKLRRSPDAPPSTPTDGTPAPGAAASAMGGG
ncbi:unnamed protein product [Prorocentrum cordatum]|uniref:Uncharacterized protein n=1 Tax=Prorocentrum cordatum TaxID=2364126 RepID=A0ABN9PD69_9DINO|nr:unnamed protein product [Polarella glacialis]